MSERVRRELNQRIDGIDLPDEQKLLLIVSPGFLIGVPHRKHAAFAERTRCPSCKRILKAYLLLMTAHAEAEHAMYEEAGFRWMLRALPLIGRYIPVPERHAAPVREITDTIRRLMTFDERHWSTADERVIGTEMVAHLLAHASRAAMVASPADERIPYDDGRP